MRNITYDNAKGIGLILVILGHLLPFGNLQSSVIYSMHMPLFFYISGIFITNKGYKRLIFNYISPYVFFQFIIGGIILMFKSFKSHDGFNELLVRFFKEIFIYSGSRFTYMDHLWFLVALVISMVFAKIILQSIEKIGRRQICYTVIIVFLSMIAIFMNKNSIILPFRLQSVPAIIMLLIIGNRYNGIISKIIETFSKFWFCILVVSFIVLSIVNRTVNMSLAVYNNYLLYLFTAFLGISIVIYISKRIHLKFLSYMGKNTLILFAIHGVWIQVYKMLLNNISISLHDMCGLYCYVGTVVVLVCSLGSYWILKKIYFNYDSLMRNVLNVEK